MAKRQRKTDQVTIDKRLKEGFGQGTGSDYRCLLSRFVNPD